MPAILSQTTLDTPVSVNGTTHGMQPSLSADVRGELMTITPQMAADLLKRKLPNRPLSKARVRALIDDLRSGRWQTNGESIILTEDLELIDGQHRLQAVYESGIAITAMVVVGIDRAVSMSIDQGRAKVGADMLAMHDMTNVNLLASTGRWLFRYERGTMRQQQSELRNDQLPRFVASRPGLQGSLQWGRVTRDLVPAAVGSMLYFVMTRHDAALAKHYFDDLSCGVGLTREAPAHVVREKLLKDKSPCNHMGIVRRAALITLGWLSIRSKKSLSASFVWRGVDDSTVPFPTVL